MNKIQHLLRAQGIRGKGTMDEYFDHFLTEYETKVENGMNPDTALAEARSAIALLNGRSITLDYYLTYHKNKLIMITALFISALYFILPYHSNQEPPSIAPVKSIEKITYHFGETIHPITKKMVFHNGMDIKGKLGDEVIAPSDGTVTESGYNDRVGHFVVIQHDEIYSTRYHHLHARKVIQNQKVKKGAIIGEIGSTGISTGPHLHYEVLKNGEHVDPSTFLGA